MEPNRVHPIGPRSRPSPFVERKCELSFRRFEQSTNDPRTMGFSQYTMGGRLLFTISINRLSCNGLSGSRV
jgi:hypothetical protein